jgi:hypothetical protein
MSDNPGYQICIAKTVTYQKVDNPVCCPTSVGSDSALWARDLHSQITSIMSNTTAYDRITHPPCPRTNIQAQTPRPFLKQDKSQTIASPHQTSRAAAYLPIPRPTPREDQDVARDGLYNGLTKSAKAPSSAASTLTLTNCTAAANARKTNYFKRLPPLPTGIHKAQSEPLRSTQERNILRHMTPLTPITTFNNAVPAKLSTMEPALTPKITPAVKAASWAINLHKKRRPSQIFNMNFSFGSPSRRRPSDHTPHISPRSSISSASTSPPEESIMKRQRIDSSGSDMPFPLLGTKVSPTHNMVGYNLGAAPEGPANIWGMDTDARLLPLPVEPHPGRPVDFSASRTYSRLGSQSYHDFLVETARRNSSPRVLRNRAPDRPKQEQLDKEARILVLDSHCASSRKRTCTVQRTEIDIYHNPLPPLTSTSTSSSSRTPTQSGSNSSTTSRFSNRTTSSMSDPSAEAFLRHVRASREARARKEGSGGKGGNSVFVDEDERGFLSDEPI